jgi:regulator of protease activity HflC (stomatin/prohibitin superfamily)
MRRYPLLATVMLGALAVGCASQDVPQAYKGRMFVRTGPLAFFTGKVGFSGPVLGPGSYFTGTYNQVRTVDCSMVTKREALTALTKDGVQFGLDIYVRFAADCSDYSVAILLTMLTPDREEAITSTKVYETFVRPAIGEAVREVVSPYRANEINDKREEILAAIRKRFVEIMTAREKQIVIVYEVNLSNLDFPDAMDAANTDRAVQAILRDKAIAERGRVQAESETMQMRRQLAEREGEMEAARIDKIGEALRRNPDFLQFDLQSKMPEIYRQAGANGNLVITAPNPSVVVSPRQGVRLPATAARPDNNPRGP